MERKIHESNDEFRKLFSTDFLFTMLDRMHDGIYIIDQEMNLVFVNEFFRKRIGEYSNGIKCHEYFHGSSETCDECKRFIVFSGQSVRWEWLVPQINRYFDIIETPLKSFDGKTLKLAVYRDITEMIEMKKLIVDSERRFRDISDNAVEWIWETDKFGRFTYVNPVVSTLLGYNEADVLGQSFDRFFPEQERQSLQQTNSFLFEKKEPYRKFVRRLVRKNGEVVWLSSSAVPVFDPDGGYSGFRGADFDITHQFVTEQRMSEALQEKTVLLNEAQHRIKNNLQIVSSLLKLQKEFNGNHSAEFVHELISNGCNHAFPGRMNGEIELEVLSTDLSKIDLVKYSDNGIGFEPASIRKGLGLHLIEFFAEQLDLNCTLQSHPGKGCSITLKSRAVATPKILPPRCGDGIFIVEDEILTAMERKSAIEKFGYRSCDALAKTGEEALELIKAMAVPPALMLIDVALGAGIDGFRTAELIREQYPNIPIIFITGYTDVGMIEGIGRLCNSDVLIKPYLSAQLREKITKMLKRVQ